MHPVLTGNVRRRASKHNQPKKANKKTNKNLKDMKIYSYNVRTHSEELKLEELIEDLENIKWDVVGLSEVRRKEENIIKLQDSHHLFYYGGKGNGKTSGVGFLINRNVADNVSKFSSISDRVAWVVFKLDKRYTLKVILNGKAMDFVAKTRQFVIQ